MKIRVKTVTAAPEEDGVDYSVIINFTTSYNGVVCVCVCVCVRALKYICIHTHTQNKGIPVTLDCGTVVRFQTNFELKCMNNLTPYNCSAFARIWVNSQRQIRGI